MINYWLDRKNDKMCFDENVKVFLHDRWFAPQGLNRGNIPSVLSLDWGFPKIDLIEGDPGTTFTSVDSSIEDAATVTRKLKYNLKSIVDEQHFQFYKKLKESSFVI